MESHSCVMGPYMYVITRTHFIHNIIHTRLMHGRCVIKY